MRMPVFILGWRGMPYKKTINPLHFRKSSSIIINVAVVWVWRSLVACLNGVQEAGGSNPLTQTKRCNPNEGLHLFLQFQLAISII